MESTEIIVVAVDGHVLDNSFEGATHKEVVASKLVECDVATIECGLCKAVDKPLLRKRQLLKPVETVSEQLYVGKSFASVKKIS